MPSVEKADPKVEGYRLLSLRGRDDLDKQHRADCDAWCAANDIALKIIETGRGDMNDRCDAIERYLGD